MTSNLLSLSDDVLLTILSNASPGDLVRLSQTCVRLSEVCNDSSLWIDVDAGSEEFPPMAEEEIEKMLPFLCEKTKSVTIRGFARTPGRETVQSVSPFILKSIGERCPNLEELTLKDCCVDAARVALDMFPSCLKTLGMSNCDVVNIPEYKAFFEGIHKHFRSGLIALDISGCQWITTADYFLISRCPELKMLIFRGCCSRHIVCSSYFNLKLAKVDQRDTLRHELMLFCVPNAEEVYLGYTSEQRRQEMKEMKGFEVIGDLSVEVLIQLRSVGSKLRFLSLTHSDVTDRGLARLAKHCLHLRRLDLTGCKRITEKGVEAFSAANGECKVVWDGMGLRFSCRKW